MTEIKKGTPVWCWDSNRDTKKKAAYLFYDDLSDEEYKHLCVIGEDRFAYKHAEPINETNDKAMKLIAEAEAKIEEAKKLLNAL